MKKITAIVKEMTPAARALQDLASIGLLTIEKTTVGGLDAPRRYTLSRSAILTERSPIGPSVQLPTSSYTLTEEYIPPPPASVFELFIQRFRSIGRLEFNKLEKALENVRAELLPLLFTLEDAEKLANGAEYCSECGELKI